VSSSQAVSAGLALRFVSTNPKLVKLKSDSVASAVMLSSIKKQCGQLGAHWQAS